MGWFLDNLADQLEQLAKLAAEILLSFLEVFTDEGH